MYIEIRNAIIGWVVPLVGGFVLTRVPAIRDWMKARPVTSSMIVSCFISILLSTFVVFAYDRYVLFSDANVLPSRMEFGGDADAFCPEGSVVTGVRSGGEGGLGHGAIYALKVACKPISSLHSVLDKK